MIDNVEREIQELSRLERFSSVKLRTPVVYPSPSNLFKYKPTGLGKGDGGDPMDFGPLE